MMVESPEVTQGHIKEIVTADKLGSRSDHIVAVIEHPWQGGTAEAWVSIPADGDFKAGDKVELFKIQPKPNLTIWSFRSQVEQA